MYGGNVYGIRQNFLYSVFTILIVTDFVTRSPVAVTCKVKVSDYEFGRNKKLLNNTFLKYDYFRITMKDVSLLQTRICLR